MYMNMAENLKICVSPRVRQYIVSQMLWEKFNIVGRVVILALGYV